MQRLITSEDETERATAAVEIGDALRVAFEVLLAEMDGRPVTVRLLDLPLDELFDDLDRVGAWREHTPMLGARGVRLLVLRPDVGRLQVTALADAIRARLDAGGAPVARLMVPFVAAATEVVFVRDLVESVIADGEPSIDLPLGAMVETPRAALLGAELAGVADFLSFGTNDLTQLTFGLSRDDTGPLLDRYLGGGLLPDDPFGTIDVAGVGELIALGVERARRADPSIEISVCGEHAGDPASIAFFRSIGVDRVSCSPFRLPGARLAAARSVLGLP